MKYPTASEIAQFLEGEVAGDGSIALSGFAAADQAKPGQLTFAENASYFARAEASAASAILVSEEYKSNRKVLIRVKNSRIAFAQVLPLFFPEPVFHAGIHPSTVVAPTAQIDPTASIGPFCVIEDGARVGPGVVLAGSNHIGADSQLGERCHLFPRVTIYRRCVLGARVCIHAGTVIGSDGFGYVYDGKQHIKVPQVGNVIIHDDVEIGANATIDRAALGSTVIGRGTKIDNLVQIAHNVVIGEHSILVAQVGVAGSTRVGNYVTVAGQAGIAGHLKIGDGATISAQSGVMHDIPPGEKWLGAPAQADRYMKRIYVALQRLPDLLQRVSALEKPADSDAGEGDPQNPAPPA